MLLAPIPASQSKPCADPVRLPDRALPQVEVEQLWARDRTALVQCGNQKAGIVDFYEDQAAGLRSSAGQ